MTEERLKTEHPSQTYTMYRYIQTAIITPNQAIIRMAEIKQKW